ncbi:MAG: DUF6922 domain-containing protein [Bacteroidota bacterium]
MEKKSFIHELSPHIFWDVSPDLIDHKKNVVFIIQRVLKYGLLKDWLIIKSEIGLQELSEYVVLIPDLDDISLHFLSNLLGIKKSEFKCYIKRQSSQNFWSY